MSNYEKINCAKPVGYKVPQPFGDAAELEELYRTLDQNRKLREQCAVQYGDRYVEYMERRDIYAQMEDAATALQDSLFYANASPDLKEEIEHQTEDRLNGIDPNHTVISAIKFISLLGIGGALSTPIVEGIGPGTLVRGPASVLCDGEVIAEIPAGAVKFVKMPARYLFKVGARTIIIGAFMAYLSTSIAYGIQHAGSVRLDMTQPLGLDEFITPEGYSIKAPECRGTSFGRNIELDQKCFGMTLFDSCGGRRCSDYNYTPSL